MSHGQVGIHAKYLQNLNDLNGGRPLVAALVYTIFVAGGPSSKCYWDMVSPLTYVFALGVAHEKILDFLKS